MLLAGSDLRAGPGTGLHCDVFHHHDPETGHRVAPGPLGSRSNYQVGRDLGDM